MKDHQPEWNTVPRPARKLLGLCYAKVGNIDREYALPLFGVNSLDLIAPNPGAAAINVYPERH